VRAGELWRPGAWGRLPWALPAGGTGDGVAVFDEVSAARGALGRFPASEFMPLVRALLAHA
jgi:2,3-bisphosphoglycerate-independent phosphoglycerate mutase